MASNRVIGRDNGIPWHLPEDFAWFKKITTGHVLLMGRKTFESIGRPLPGRQTIVLTRNPQTIPGVLTISALAQLDLSAESRNVFVCGGAQVYQRTLSCCSDLYLTLLKRSVAGDTFFPAFEQGFFEIEVILDRPEFTILHYRNRDPQPWPPPVS